MTPPVMKTLSIIDTVTVSVLASSHSSTPSGPGLQVRCHVLTVFTPCGLERGQEDKMWTAATKDTDNANKVYLKNNS